MVQLVFVPSSLCSNQKCMTVSRSHPLVTVQLLQGRLRRIAQELRGGFSNPLKTAVFLMWHVNCNGCHRFAKPAMCVGGKHH